MFNGSKYYYLEHVVVLLTAAVDPASEGELSVESEWRGTQFSAGDAKSAETTKSIIQRRQGSG